MKLVIAEANRAFVADRLKLMPVLDRVDERSFCRNLRIKFLASRQRTKRWNR